MKLRSFGICILLIAILFCLALPMQTAFAESGRAVVLLDKQMDGDRIVVNATLRNNEAISQLQLNLEYDHNKLRLIGFDRGPALSTLTVIETKNYDAKNFSITWSGDDNDGSNGKLCTLIFEVKENATGKVSIGFKDSIALYIDHELGDHADRELKTDTLTIDLVSGEFTSDIAAEETRESSAVKEKRSKGLIVSLAVGGTAVILMIIGVPWFMMNKKRV